MGCLSLINNYNVKEGGYGAHDTDESRRQKEC